MECFIKKVLAGKHDDASHRQFVRFGKGEYKGRAALSLMKTAKIKLGGSFEYANDFAEVVAELGNAKFSGVILSKDKLGLDNEKLKSGLYNYEVSGIDANKIKEIKDKAYYMLLDADGSGMILKSKKKLPKPGKAGDLKIDDKFCVLEADLNYWNKIKESFFWDVGECRKIKLSHTYEITDLEMPRGEKDFEKIRLLTKRKGKIKRILEVDGQLRESEKEFSA
jgi:hypothetical protein